MGFSGGGSNVLKPHTHDGTVVQDGGSLNFNNITQSSSSAGQIFYSDGVHLQQLAYPGVPAGEALTAVAASTQPSWTAIPSPPAGGKMVLLEDQTASGSGATPITWTPGTPLTSTDYSYLRFVIKADETLTGLSQFWCEVNSLVSGYGLQGQGQQGGGVVVLNNPYGTAAWNFYDPMSPSASSWIFTMDLALPTTVGSNEMTMLYQAASNDVYVGGGGYVTGTGATFTGIEFNFQGSASVRSTDFQVYGIET